MTNRKFLMIGGCGLVFLGGGVLFAVLELRDWRAEKKAEKVLVELQQHQEQRMQELQDEIDRKKHRQRVLMTLMFMLRDEIGSWADDLNDKLKIACLEKKTDKRVEQLFEEVVAISIEVGEDEEKEEEIRQLLRDYSGTDMVGGRSQKLRDAMDRRSALDVLRATLRLMEANGFNALDGLSDKFKAACLGKKTDKLVEQLLEDAVAIIKADDYDEEDKKLEQLIRNYNSRKDGSKKHRQDVLETLEIILGHTERDLFEVSGDLYDKLKAAYLGKKTDKRVEQLFEEAVAISIKTEGKNDGGEEEMQKLKQLLRSYYGLKDVP